MKMEIDAVKKREFEEYMAKLEGTKGALMPVLQDAQQRFGYLPEEIIDLISEKMKIFTSEIYGVATFYSQFTFVPKGKYSISVCLGTACYVNGAKDILDEFGRLLGIGIGETTSDMKFSLVETRCVGACSEAPVVVVNNKIYPRFKKEQVEGLIEELRERRSEDG